MWRIVSLLLVLTLSSPYAPAAVDEPTTKPAEPPAPIPRADVLIVPLHVHVLSSASNADLDCKLTDADLERILLKVNRIWRQAGVQFHVQPIHREEAVNVSAFEKLKDTLKSGAFGPYAQLGPPETRKLPGLHVYYVHALLPNGFYLGNNICFIKETARIKEVKGGGIDEPIPRVTAHELGHALGLRHRQDTTNLMASGTTGTSFNEAEVRIARGKAKAVQGAMTVEEAMESMRAAREEGGDAARAESLRNLLERI